MSLDIGAVEVYDYIAKIVLIGDCGVGKSCLLSRWVDNTFSETWQPTIAVDFNVAARRIGRADTFSENTFREGLGVGDAPISFLNVKAQIWDLSGQERFLCITRSYYTRAQVVMVVYSATDHSTFVNARLWVQRARHLCSADTVYILVGNHYDSSDTDACNGGLAAAGGVCGDGRADQPERRETCPPIVTKEEGAQLARELGLYFVAVSAKTGEGVNDALVNALRFVGRQRQPPAFRHPDLPANAYTLPSSLSATPERVALTAPRKT